MKLFYKIFLMIFICTVSLLTMGQNMIRPITISLPPKPRANTADWAAAMPPVIITAQTKMENGSIPYQVSEGTMLVTIKSGGNTVCGTYTPQTAPASNFTSTTKTWKGSEVLNLLGKDCILKPGAYELCVQFFTRNPATGAQAVTGEACKSFTIEDAKEQTYSPPQNIMPVNDKVFTEPESNMPVSFRWAPVIPRPKDPVTYRLKVWQLMEGQNAAAAIRANQPIVTKDIDNITQASVTNLNSEPCKLPYLCRYVWNVEALSKEVVQGKNKSYGISEATAFSIIINDPSAGCMELDTTKYTIVCNGVDASGKPIYRVKDLILKNIGTNPGNTGNNGFPPTNYVVPFSSGISIANLVPISATNILPGTSVNNISFDIFGATGTTASVIVNANIPSPTNPSIACNKNIQIIFDLPSCACTACDSIQIKLGQQYLSQTGNDVDIVQTITTLVIPANTPLKIKSLTAEIIYLDIIKDAKECYQCEKNSDHLGKFLLTSTSLAGFTNTSSLPGDEIVYNAATAKALGNTPFKFTISAPELNKCCNDTVHVCLRYSIVTEDCKTCSVTQCYQLPRTK